MPENVIKEKDNLLPKGREEEFMRKFLAGLLTIVSVFALTACTSNGNESGLEEIHDANVSTDINSQASTEALTTITVGASTTPHAEILAVVKEDLAAQGYNLEIVEFSDYVLPNTSLEDGSLDANYFQHKPYLDSFNAENGTSIVSVANIHYEPFGIYPGKTAALADLQDGAKIAVPNDTTNEARALLLLEQEGLIKLKEGAGIEATKNDIIENPHNYEIVELQAEQIARALPDVDLGVINGNNALAAGLNVAKDAIAKEAADSLAAQTYANIVAVKSGNETNPGIVALIEVLQSDKVKNYIETTYEGSVVPAF